jgi:ubiquinol-cytochrome c reductase cytochrome c subunit
MAMNAFFLLRHRRGRALLLAVILSILTGTNGQAQEPTSGINPTGTPAPASPVLLVDRGHTLFLMNCAHCHGADATGDEGPDLHGLLKSDARLAALIKNGIKGEMPKFSAKFSDADIGALIVFIHSLK